MQVNAQYLAIGTDAVPVALTATFSDNTATFNAKFLENFHLDVKYKSNGDGNYLQILVEVRNEDSTTFFPQSVKSIGTTEIDDFVLDGSGANGIPIDLPGGKTSANGTTYKGQYDADIVAYEVRISWREVVAAGSAGTIYGHLTLSNKVG